MPAATLKQKYRITKIETVDAAAAPGMPSTGASAILVTGVPVTDPANPSPAGATVQPYQWRFDNVAEAAGFFDADQTYECSFALAAPAA